METARPFAATDAGPRWRAAPPTLPSVSGVLSRRVGAYLVDLLAISCLVLVFGFAVTLAGFLTFGLGFLLYGILVPAVAIGYGALTVGGPGQGTWGMRLLDLRAADARDGGPVGPLAAAAHAVLFYVAAGTTLLVVDILIGLVRSDKRLGHDLMTGIVLVRRSGAR